MSVYVSRYDSNEFCIQWELLSNNQSSGDIVPHIRKVFFLYILKSYNSLSRHFICIFHYVYPFYFAHKICKIYAGNLIYWWKRLIRCTLLECSKMVQTAAKELLKSLCIKNVWLPKNDFDYTPSIIFLLFSKVKI